MSNAYIAIQLVKDLLEETNHSKKEDPDVHRCIDIVDQLSSSPNLSALSPIDARRMLNSLATVPKAVRVLKRANADWMPVHETLRVVFERLREIAETTTADATLSTSTPSCAIAKDSDTRSSSKHREGILPRTVQEYHERLKQHKKELYKNPPVLPPHSVRVESSMLPFPKRHSANKTFIFVPGNESDASSVEFIAKFRPNLSPEEILRSGAFGGTYFRSIESSVTNQTYTAKDALDETVLPEWISGLDKKLYLTSATYRTSVNKYGVKCGGSLGMWESSGWISDADPYGWFQWYCRFFQGRRCSDDGRQISRWLGVAGSKGRFRTQLLNKILASKSIRTEEAWKDVNISPVIRQTLLHWGLNITREMVQEHKNRVAA